MSATVYWRPVQPKKGKALDGQSSFLASLARAFDQDASGPVYLTAGNAPALRAMSAATTHWDQEMDDDYTTLADALEHHESIEVWAEY